MDRKFVIGILVIIILAAVMFFLFFRQTKAACGNGIKELGENCFDCPKDNPCLSGEYCSPVTKQCTKLVCGDSRCEPGESMSSCCDDCGCGTKYEICNKTSHRCFIPEVNISDERAIALATSYLRNQNRTIAAIWIVGPSYYQEKHVKDVAANIAGEIKPALLAITTDGMVYEYITY